MTSSFESTAADLGLVTFQPDVPGQFERAAVDPPSEDSEAQVREAQARLQEEAFESGYEQGLATARLECEPAIRALSAAAAELCIQRQAYLPAQRRLIVELAVTIAERIVGDSLADNPGSIIDRIAAALPLPDPGPEVVVELHPRDHALASEVCEPMALLENVQLVANPDLTPGDFLATNGSTTIDSRLSSILEETRRMLAGLETLPGTASAGNEGENP